MGCVWQALEVEAKVLNLGDEGAAGYAKFGGGFGAVAFPALKGALDGEFFDFAEGKWVGSGGGGAENVAAEFDVVGGDKVGVGEDGGALEDVFEFADVAAKIVAFEFVHGLRGKAGDVTAHGGVEFFDYVRGDEGDVFFALA